MGLIIRRNPGQSIKIGDDIEVILLDGSKRTGLLIHAPGDVLVLRSELAEGQNAEDKASAND